jgi:hypothetical protein
MCTLHRATSCRSNEEFFASLHLLTVLYGFYLCVLCREAEEEELLVQNSLGAVSIGVGNTSASHLNNNLSTSPSHFSRGINSALRPPISSNLLTPLTGSKLSKSPLSGYLSANSPQRIATGASAISTGLDSINNSPSASPASLLRPSTAARTGERISTGLSLAALTPQSIHMDIEEEIAPQNEQQHSNFINNNSNIQLPIADQFQLQVAQSNLGMPPEHQEINNQIITSTAPAEAVNIPLRTWQGEAIAPAAQLSAAATQKVALENEIKALDEEILSQQAKISSAANKILQNRLNQQLITLQRQREEKQQQLQYLH